jgi:ribonucleoside-triphosphate reductase
MVPPGYQTIQSYDRIYSDWFAVPLSIKTTSIKPSGTVSLLAGATPGCHWPEALHYLRRMRLSIHSDLVAPLKAAGYHIEPAVGSEDTTLVVAVPVKIDDAGGRLRTVGQVSMWEQVAMAAFLQEYWADNQVSCTVTFRPEEGPQIAHGPGLLPVSPEGHLVPASPGEGRQVRSDALRSHQ